MNSNLICSSEFFPASELPPPPKPKVIIQNYREERYEATARGRGRQTREVPTLRRENAIVGTPPNIEDAGPSTPNRKRKRTISDRELRNLNGDDSESKQVLESSKKRLRKPPRRFGQNE